MKKYTRGFTLIELLVVIAIIGILSSVVLVSLNSARSKGNDSKVQSQLSGFRAAAEMFYSNNNAYTSAAAVTDGSCSQVASVFADPVANQYVKSANLPTGVTTYCYHDGAVGTKATKYILLATLPSTPTSAYCVDSSGNSKTVTATNYDSANKAQLAQYICN